MAGNIRHFTGQNTGAPANVQAKNEFLKYQVFDAINGHDQSADSFVASEVCDGTVNYSRGTVGCALSHVALWKRAAEGIDPITISEDDAIFHSKFVELSAAIIAKLGTQWDLVLWGWNFDSVLSCKLIPGLTACDVRFNQADMRSNAAGYLSSDIAPSAYKLFKAFGIPCYSITPAGARKLLQHSLPIRKMDVYFPGLNRTLPNNGIDIMMNQLYPTCAAFVSFPPLVLTNNDHAISTIQEVQK